MDEKIKEIEKHEWDSHPKWHLANTGWYQCKICNKEHFCKIIPPVFPPEICEVRILRNHIKELEERIKKHKRDKQNMIQQAHCPGSGSYLDPWDIELYELVEI